MGAKGAVAIELSDEERDALERQARRRKISRAEAQRAQIVLLAADGANNCEIARSVGVTRQTARAWRERFARARLDGLSDEPRCGAPRKIGDDQIEAIIVKTLEQKPANATHWSTRDMARASGVSMHAAPPGPRVPQVPRRSRAQRPRRVGHPRRDGQRLDPQDQADPRLVCRAPAPAYALHAGIVLLTQSGRTLLRPDHRQTNQARRPRVRESLDQRYSNLHRPTQRQTSAPAMDKVRR